jgi:hypothetical protein
MDLQHELHALEEAFWTGGPEAYLNHCDEKCLVVFPGMATVMLREQIAQTAKKGRWRRITIKPMGIVTPTDATAVIGYECDAEREDGHKHHALVSSGYVKRGSGWKLASHQQCVEAASQS